jgi:hypothetical protein
MTRVTWTWRRCLTVAALATLGIAYRADADCVDGTTHSCTVNGEPGTMTCEGGEWSECEGPNGPLPPPPTYHRPQRTARTGTSITLKNFNPADTGTYRLQHQAPNGTWATIATVSPGASYVHTGLTADTRHCYRFLIVPGPTTGPSCGYTTDVGFAAWRVQIELQTGDVGDASSGDAVSVKLDDLDEINDASFTWLDYGRADFQRNTTHAYDLNLDNLAFRGDIHRVEIHKYGTDGWCLAGFRVLVNGVETYTQTFAAQPGGCLWLDNDDGHSPSVFVQHATLRAHPSWTAFVQPARFGLSGVPAELVATLRIPRAELESRVEALMGHHLHGEAAYWGGLEGARYVEATQASIADAVHFDLDLKASVDVLPNPKLDVDFDLKFDAQCSTDGRRADVALSIENLESDADFEWWAELLVNAFTCVSGQPDCTDFAENTIEDRLERAFGSIALPGATAQVPQGYRCQDARVDVASDGTVRLIFQLMPAPPIIPTVPAIPTVPVTGS